MPGATYDILRELVREIREIKDLVHAYVARDLGFWSEEEIQKEIQAARKTMEAKDGGV